MAGKEGNKKGFLTWGRAAGAVLAVTMGTQVAIDASQGGLLHLPGIHSESGSSHTQDTLVSKLDTKNYPTVGKPTISKKVFIEVLAEAGSPVESNGVHLGGAMYDQILQSGADPNVVVSMFFHESDAGKTGVATQTLNVCNMRPFPGYQQSDPLLTVYNNGGNPKNQFLNFSKHGIEGWVYSAGQCGWLLREQSDNAKLKTVGEVIPVLAPAGDRNVPSSYVSAVKQMMRDNNERSLKEAGQVYLNQFTSIDGESFEAYLRRSIF